MFTRRQTLQLALAAAASPGSIATALAAPSSLNIFVPAAPGGGWDQTARSIEAALRKDKIISSIRIEHRPGAGGAVGLPVFVATRKGQPDAIMIGGLVMVGALIANASPVGLSQVTPLARLTGEAEVIVVPAQSPFRTIADLVAAFRKEPGKVSFAGGSAGGTDHILAGMLAKTLGLDPRKVAYVAYAGGGPAQAALLGNQVSAGISGVGEFAEQIKAGKLRALAVSSARRVPGLDAPTLKESGIDVDLTNWRGVFGPPGLSEPQKADLIALVDRMVAGAGWKAELATRGWDSLPLTGAAFATFIDAEIRRVGAILGELGLKK